MIYYIIFNVVKSIIGNNLVGLVLFLSLGKRYEKLVQLHKE